MGIPGEHAWALRVGQLERRYVVHVPRGYDGKAAIPAVIMLHGGGGTARAAMRETGWAGKADEAGFLAVFPEATGPNPRAPGNFVGNPQTWNDGSGRFHSGSTNVDDVGFINALIDGLPSRFAVDGRRIFVAGFSNGASMAYRVGAELSGRIAAIAPISGHLWLKDLQPLRPVPLISIAGTADPLNPLDGGEVRVPGGGVEHRPPLRDSVLRWAKLNGCQPEPAVIRDTDGVRWIAYSPCLRGSEVEFYTVEGLGHTWPGGQSLLPATMVGRTSGKLRANDVIWRFFERHPQR